MQCVGLNFSNIAMVCSLLRKSPSFELAKIHVSLSLHSSWIILSIALPTRPEPPVTRTTVLFSPFLALNSAMISAEQGKGVFRNCWKSNTICWLQPIFIATTPKYQISEIFDGIGCSCTSASTSSVGQVSVLGVVHPIRARSMNVCGIKMYLQHNKFIHRYSVF